MLEQLLTVKDVSQIMQVSEVTVREYIKNGILSPCKNLCSEKQNNIRFTQQHIREVLEVRIEKTSPIYVKRLEKELENAKIQIQEYEKFTREMSVKSNSILNKTLGRQVS